jgi:GAF domain-containing protein
MSSNYGQSREALEAEVASLRHQVAELGKYKLALDAQEKLFRSVLTMSHVSSGKLMLRSILLEIIDFSRQLLKAERASLFILAPDGRVTESILARGPTIQEDKQLLIGKVLDKGLAGWVVRNRQIALIRDTMKDERWLNLPQQPYYVRSALCIPFLRGQFLLGILTLTHSQPKHFSQSMADFMAMYAPSIAIALDHARLHLQDLNLGEDNE